MVCICRLVAESESLFFFYSVLVHALSCCCPSCNGNTRLGPAEDSRNEMGSPRSTHTEVFTMACGPSGTGKSELTILGCAAPLFCLHVVAWLFTFPKSCLMIPHQVGNGLELSLSSRPRHSSSATSPLLCLLLDQEQIQGMECFARGMQAT